MTTTYEHTGTRMAGDERRLQILETAARLFSENGFRGTTTKKIAKASGISEAMVFRHFESKEDLYSAILDHKACSMGLKNPFEDVAEEINSKDDYGLFYGIALNALTHHREDKEFIRLLLYSALEGHDLNRMFLESYVSVMNEFLSRYIKTRQEDGVFVEIEPKIIVRAFVGMMIHHSLSNTLWDKEQQILKISDEEAAGNFANILLKGIMK